jgi:GNAT superfamily N-acetyltransferase
LEEDGGGLAGVLHAFRGYRVPGEWYLGLLLLDPRARGAGLGEAFYFGFEAWAAGLGAGKIQLAVLECNERAARFWERVGFVLPRCYPAMAFGLRRHVVIEYEKAVMRGAGAPFGTDGL